MPVRSLSEILLQLRRRVLAIDGTAGLLWGLVAGSLWVGVGVWFDLILELPAPLRIAIVTSACLLAALLFVAILVRACAKSSAAFLARRLDDVTGSGGQVLSGVELSAPNRESVHSHNPKLTYGLAELAVAEATRPAAGACPVAVHPPRPIFRSLLSLAAVAAAGLAIVLLLPGLAATEWRRFADPFGDHPPFSAVEFDVEPGDASVVYGSGLDIHVTSRGAPVEGIELVWRSQPDPGADDDPARVEPVSAPSPREESLPMFPESSSRWRGTIASIVSPAEYFVRGKTARSRRFQVRLITVPKIAAVTFRITPPEYTRLPQTEGAAPAGGLSGLPGTVVQVVVRSNRPLSSGNLSYLSRDERSDVQLLPTAPGSDSVMGSFAITESGRIEIAVDDVAGQRSTDTFSTSVTRLVDEHPFVRMLEPKGISYATPTALIQAAVSAEDDYGISRLQLFRNLNDSRFLELGLPVASPPPRQAYQVVPLPLADYGLEPGDEIKLFARVEDNDPASVTQTGYGKGAESSIVTIRIISQEEFDRLVAERDGFEALISKYQAIRRRMESLKEEIEDLQKRLAEQPADQNRDEDSERQLEKLTSQLRDAMDAVSKLESERSPFAIDKELKKELSRMKEPLERLQKRAESLAQNKSLRNGQLSGELEEMLAELQKERERLDGQVMEPLEMLAKIIPLKQDENRFVELYRLQRDLEGRLSSLKNSEREDNPAIKSRMRDLEAEQRQIHLALEGLLADIEDHATRISDDEDLRDLHESALEFVQAVRASAVFDEMNGAESALAEFSGGKGHRAAKAAADILEQFLSKCKGMGEGGNQACRARFNPSLSAAMQQTLAQLLGNGMGGMGDGEGGYSAHRNSLDNVGLYGQTPSSDAQARAGEGKSNRQRGSGAGQGAGDESADRDAESHRAEGRFKATAGSEESIPLRYRRRVGRYFQRIADELGTP